MCLLLLHSILLCLSQEPVAGSDKSAHRSDTVDSHLTDVFADESFESHAQLALIRRAVDSGDTELLVDVALQTGHGEQILRRKRKSMSASELCRLAMEMAASQGDIESLARLEEGAQDFMDAESLNVISPVRAVSGPARKLDIAPGLRPEETTAESLVLYSALAKEIREARILLREGNVKDLIAALPALALHPKQRAHLAQLSEDALMAIRTSENTALSQFVASGRSARFSASPLKLIAGRQEILLRTASQELSYLVVLRASQTQATTVFLQSDFLKVPGTVTVPAGVLSAPFTAQVPPMADKRVFAQREASVRAMDSAGGAVTLKLSISGAGH